MFGGRIAAATMAAASLLIVGCGSNGTALSPPSSSPSAAVQPSPAPTQTQTARTLTFTLIACTGPTACANADPLNQGPSKFGRGVVRIDVSAETYTITVTASGFTPRSTHLINMHPGTCASPNLTQNEKLVVATADSRGNLASVIKPDGAYFIPGPGKILTIHGDDVARTQTHIACANLAN